MEDLLQKYHLFDVPPNKLADFRTIYNKTSLKPIEEWLEKRFENPINIKNDTKSISFRMNGNKLYANKKYFRRSIEFYTKSLNFAEFNGEAYSLALANRSAVFFELKDYLTCLNDINLCLEAKYPENLKYKVLIRKCECLKNVGLKDELEKTIKETTECLENMEIANKEKYFEFLNKLECVSNPPLNETRSKSFDEENELNYERSKNFLYATTAVRMNYDEKRGRHVVANRQLQRGDVLFVEKAFMFAPIFTENKEIILNKCYNCLSNVKAPIPCKTCTLCIYCDKSCRDKSWHEHHIFECKGMQINLWYDIGIAFPALKAMLKGVKSGFENLTDNYESDLLRYGNINNNYGYFNRLLAKIPDRSNGSASIIQVGVIITYLEKKTQFFTWLLAQNNFSGIRNLKELKILIGNLIVRHIAQLSCNSSIIEHWVDKVTENGVSEELVQVACGIFPSVSIMNHSCKPNITMYFVKDTVIVKALDAMGENEEIFNCYGADYRFMSLTRRQEICLSYYGFECKCEICCNPMLEIDVFDFYKCKACSGPIDINNLNCQQCSSLTDSTHFENVEKLYSNYLNMFTKTKEYEYLEELLKICKENLMQYHKYFCVVFELFYRYNLENNNLSQAMEYFKKWLEIREKRYGHNFRSTAIKMNNFVLNCIDLFNEMSIEDFLLKKDLFKEIESMHKEVKCILSLYYPPNMLNFKRVEQSLDNLSNIIKLKNNI